PVLTGHFPVRHGLLREQMVVGPDRPDRLDRGARKAWPWAASARWFGYRSWHCRRMPPGCAGPLLFHLMEQMPAPHAAYPIRAVDRVCDILDALAEAGRPVSLPEVAAAAELPKSSTFRYLAALEARRYVERSAGGGEYQLGPAFRSPGAQRLAARVGERGPVHATALGKAMCAALPEAQVRAMLSQHGLPAFTESTITDPNAYLAELETVREQGYGVDDQENQLAGRCVAAPL